jgi:hypothetical protein
MPPLAPIRRWLERKRVEIAREQGESRGHALDRAAFRVARAIARRGIKAVEAFAKGAARVLPRLRGIFDRHFARIVR